MDAHSGCPVVWGSPGHIDQVLTNLCTNACQALAIRGSRLALRLQGVHVDDALSAEHGVRTGAALRVVVQDDGPGIAPEALGRVFDPFFTTKRVGEGIGLGLSIVYLITTRHHGAVVVRSKLGEGTTFELYFPAESGVPQPGATSTASTPTTACRSARVLCVDDDAAVLRTLEAMLEAQGHKVTSCTSPTGALAMVERDARGFDSVITDQRMPQLTGVGLARALLGIRADLPVVLMSGFWRIWKTCLTMSPRSCKSFWGCVPSRMPLHTSSARRRGKRPPACSDVHAWPLSGHAAWHRAPTARARGVA